MNIILLFLIVACSYMELSQKVDTDNLIEKISMVSIVLGSGLQLAHVQTNLILYGTSLYFITISYRAFINKQNRRQSDKRETN
jgi:hypothetical protein